MHFSSKAIIFKNSKYLIQLRDNKRNIFFPNHWAFFGGRFKTLYHLITDTKTFHIDNVEVYDYNAAIENILDMREKFL